MAVLSRSVVIGDFDFVRIATLTAKADAILVVNPNAVLPAPVSAQTLKTVSRRHRRLSDVADTIDSIQPAPGYRPYGSGTSPPSGPRVGAIEYVLGTTILKRANHMSYH